MKRITIISAGGCVSLAYQIGSMLSSINEPIQVFAQTSDKDSLTEPNGNRRFLEIGEIVSFVEEEKPEQKRGVVPVNFYKKFNRKK